MSGIVVVSEDRSWSVTSWLFDHVVSGVAKEIAGTPLAAEIEEDVANNFLFVELRTDDERALFRRGLTRFAASVDHRSSTTVDVLDHVGRLLALLVPRFPTRAEVGAVLDGLVAGTTSRDEAAAWAGAWCYDDEGPEPADMVVWDALSALVLADAEVPEGWVYVREDFEDWRTAFVDACSDG